MEPYQLPQVTACCCEHDVGAQDGARHNAPASPGLPDPQRRGGQRPRPHPQCHVAEHLLLRDGLLEALEDPVRQALMPPPAPAPGPPEPAPLQGKAMGWAARGWDEGGVYGQKRGCGRGGPWPGSFQTVVPLGSVMGHGKVGRRVGVRFYWALPTSSWDWGIRKSLPQGWGLAST